MGKPDMSETFNDLINYVICSYIQYSNIAARVVRRALKPDLQADAAKREVSSIKFKKWINGKPEGKNPMNYQLHTISCHVALYVIFAPFNRRLSIIGVSSGPVKMYGRFFCNFSSTVFVETFV